MSAHCSVATAARARARREWRLFGLEQVFERDTHRIAKGRPLAHAPNPPLVLIGFPNPMLQLPQVVGQALRLLPNLHQILRPSRTNWLDLVAPQPDREEFTQAFLGRLVAGLSKEESSRLNH